MSAYQTTFQLNTNRISQIPNFKTLTKDELKHVNHHLTQLMQIMISKWQQPIAILIVNVQLTLFPNQGILSLNVKTKRPLDVEIYSLPSSYQFETPNFELNQLWSLSEQLTISSQFHGQLKRYLQSLTISPSELNITELEPFNQLDMPKATIPMTEQQIEFAQIQQHVIAIANQAGFQTTSFELSLSQRNELIGKLSNLCNQAQLSVTNRQGGGLLGEAFARCFKRFHLRYDNDLSSYVMIENEQPHYVTNNALQILIADVCGQLMEYVAEHPAVHKTAIMA